MFQFFRRKDTAVRIFLGAILVMVCIMLVVTLIPGLTGSAPSDELVLATVRGEPITSSEVTRKISQLTRNRGVPPGMLAFYVPQILDQIVMDKVVLQEAERMGLTVSPEELATHLTLNPELFADGKFIGRERYQGLIESQFGMSVPQFEEYYRSFLLQEKLRRVVTAAITVKEEEVEREFHRRNDKLRIEYVLLKTSDLKGALQLSEAEVADYFKKNSARYEVPERRQFKLVFVETAKLKDTVPVSDKDLQRFYNENKDHFRVQDRARVSHILLKIMGKSPQETEAVRKKAQDLLERVRKGEDFAQLAKQNSDDAATTPKGGELGWIVRGQTVPQFEQAAFSLQPGSLSDVIQTQYGFHILKVHERQRAHLQTLEEVRDQILPQLRQELAQRAAEELARKAENALKKNPGNLQAVAAQFGLPVIETGLLKRGDPLPQAGSSPSLAEALFARDLTPNAMTPVVQAPTGMVIATLVQISPAHPAQLSEVREQLENELRTEKAGQLAISRMKELAEQARKAGDLKKVAAAQKLTLKTSEPFTRDGAIPDLGAASAANTLGEATFSMNVGEIGGPAVAVDGQVIFRILERQKAPTEDLARNKLALRRELADRKRSLTYELFADQLKARLEREGKLKVDKAAMDRLTASYQ